MARAKSPLPTRRSVVAKNNVNQGLVALDSDAMRDVLRDTHNLSVVTRLKRDLEKLEVGLKPYDPPKRGDALKLMRVLHRAVFDLTAQSGGAARLSDQVEAIQYSAKSADFLASIMGQLVDLDHGRVGDLFRPAGGGGNPFTYEENAIRNMALIAMQAIRQPNGLQKRKTLPMVYDEVAKALKKAGIHHHGQEIDAKLLRSWWTYKPKKRHQNAALSFDED